MNKLGIWGIVIAAAFVVGLIISSSLAFAPPGQQGTKFQELWDAIFGLQTQFDDLEERVAALEGSVPPPPPPPPVIELSFFVDSQPIESFGDAQVVHMVLFDPSIDDTDEGKGVPDVDVNENALKLAQGVDGNWHAYFADSTNALIADSEVIVPGIGSDFGAFCSQTSGNVLGPFIDVTETEGFAIQDPALVTNAVDGNAAGTQLTNECTDPNPTETPNDLMSVLNGVVVINPNFPSAELDGQLGVRKGFWPFIQLFSFTQGVPVDVRYNVGGGAVSAQLSYLGPSDLVVFVESIVPSAAGKIVTISGTGAQSSQNVIINIFASDGQEIEELTVRSTGDGRFEIPWIAPNDLPPGTYIITAKDSLGQAQTSFVLE